MGFHRIKTKGKETQVMISVSKEDLERAVGNLLQFADIIGPWFKQKDFEGKGQQDAEDVRKDLQTGSAACEILLQLTEEAIGKAIKTLH